MKMGQNRFRKVHARLRGREKQKVWALGPNQIPSLKTPGLPESKICICLSLCSMIVITCPLRIQIWCTKLQNTKCRNDDDREARKTRKIQLPSRHQRQSLHHDPVFASAKLEWKRKENDERLTTTEQVPILFELLFPLLPRFSSFSPWIYLSAFCWVCERC